MPSFSEMFPSIFVQRVIQSSISFSFFFFFMDYAERFSCLTIHFHTKGTHFFQIVPFFYVVFKG